MGFFKKIKKVAKKVGKIAIAPVTKPTDLLVQGVTGKKFDSLKFGTQNLLPIGGGVVGGFLGGPAGAKAGFSLGSGLQGAVGGGGKYSLTGGSGGGKGKETSTLKSTTTENFRETTLSPADQALLRGLSAQMSTNANKYTRDAAIADSQGVVQSVTRQLRESAIPQILAGQVQAGGYDSTGSTALANDAVQRASESASTLALDQISKYGQIQTSNLTGAANVLEALKGAETTRNLTKTLDQTGTGNTQLGGGLLGGIQDGLSTVKDIGEIGGIIDSLFGRKPGSVDTATS